ncbi:sterile alpha motif domain-containing protein 3-like isoform X1 [Acanthochromis polyacanthus]|uniref:sterile alpha motif domain-containing protein 3-like isoform X1 n=2 Tax=Acanthochromis polyacanthus TaxID=80966 RepID=UPI002234C2CA|nr:sterile alpha motif domain-containing protein 3-like isoform X1 [Acanthochromis polyacanthus]XP_051802175.1 sterile alpha motif domain-containing protein 3-like isoform X1 [Acanthochromis polyacanthus]
MSTEPGRIMTESQPTKEMKLRIIVHDNDIRKITLSGKPQTLDSLVEQLEEKLGLLYKFSLQYEDPDFNNAFVNLTDITDLPDKSTLKIIALVPAPTSSIASTASTDDTEILSFSSPESRSSLTRSPWPDTFDIPYFPVDIEYRLRQGNLLYMRDKTYLQVSRDMKHEILEKLAEAIYSFKAYPCDQEFNDVATALIQKHPCLTEPGSVNGCNSWKNSIKFKMGNYRTKLRRAGCTDVTVNQGKRKGQAPQRGIKRPKRFEINFLPNFPDGEDETSMEFKRKELVEEMKKRRPPAALITKNMDSTFALRRQELVNLEPPVKDTMERWPALFTECQILEEFCRLSSKNLNTEFFKELDKYTPRFFEIFKTKGGSVGQKLKTYLQQVTPESTDVTAKRTAVLRGLPVILGDENTDFFMTCFDCDDPGISHTPIGILTTVPEDEQLSLDSLHLQTSGTAIILEGRIVMDDLENLPHAMCLLFGLTYALNLEYPQQLKYTFDFIQRVLLSLGHKSLKPKIQSLKNLLMQ